MTKISKVIHCIWLGKNPLDKISLKCIKTWEDYLPDYKIVYWDDDKCKEIIKQNNYAKEAFEAKKYAFVSDYVRLYILYEYGGIYMDTDVQVLKPLDPFLKHSAFTSFEGEEYILTALLGAEKGNKWIKYLLDDYASRHFVLNDGSFDYTTNVTSNTNLSTQLGFKSNGKRQIFSDDVNIYPREYFCPLDTSSSKNDLITENTFAIHLNNGSWTPKWRRIASKWKKRLGVDPRSVLGGKLYEKISRKF